MTTYWWDTAQKIPSVRYQCGYCGENLVSNSGFNTYAPPTSRERPKGIIAICHFCERPTFIDMFGVTHPGSLFGNAVDHLPNVELSTLYDEARRCMSVNAYTAAILCCRKLLLNIAVSKGANVGWTFQQCVDYLAVQGYIPPDGKVWVDHIRSKGNEATHDIQLMTREDAQDLIMFIEMLLKFIFEFPVIMKNKQATKP